MFTSLFFLTLLAVDLAVTCFALGYSYGLRRAYAGRAMSHPY